MADRKGAFELALKTNHFSKYIERFSSGNSRSCVSVLILRLTIFLSYDSLYRLHYITLKAYEFLRKRR